MLPTFVVYVDESGDEGFQFRDGSSEWFVLSAVVLKKITELDGVKLVDEVRARLKKPPKKPLHFRRLKHDQRVLYVNRIAEANLTAMCVLLHKPSLHEPELFQERYRLYFYMVRYLLERVSWYCRDHRPLNDEGDGSATVVFSNRSGMSYKELCGYLELLQSKSDVQDIRIKWSVIRPDQVAALTMGKRKGLQLADAVAGSLYRACETNQFGFTEDKYARMLAPVMYAYRGCYLGYGLKFWPGEILERLDAEGRFKWVNELYR